MSSVRMCDGCAEIFSENSEGWATQNATINKRNDKGQMISVSAQLDKCSDCVELEMNRSNLRLNQNTPMLRAQPHYVEDNPE